MTTLRELAQAVVDRPGAVTASALLDCLEPSTSTPDEWGLEVETATIILAELDAEREAGRREAINCAICGEPAACFGAYDIGTSWSQCGTTPAKWPVTEVM